MVAIIMAAPSKIENRIQQEKICFGTCRNMKKMYQT